MKLKNLARRYTEELVRGILDSAPDAMIIADEAGRITMLNRMAGQLFGYRAHQLVGQPVEWLLPSAQREAHVQNRLRFSSAPSPRSMGAGLDLQGQRQDGSCFPVDISLNTLRLAGQTLVVAAIRDITLRRQQAQQLRELNIDLENRVQRRTEQLQATNQDLASFSYSIAHDLRAPLRATIAFATRVADQYASTLDAEGRRLLGVVTRSAKDMSRMIDDYLRLSGLSQIGLQHEVIDMTSLAQDVWNAVVADLERPPLLSLERLPPVNADRSLLRQVWTNVLSNAVKFTRTTKQPCVRISGSVDHRSCRYRVDDNGVGFDAAFASKLFRVFERLHTQAEFEGHGVGLCIVQRILQRHDGNVSITAVPGSGATVEFWLPDAR